MIRYIMFPLDNIAIQTRVIRVENGIKTVIPFDTRSAEYAEYLAWLDLGNTPEPFENL